MRRSPNALTLRLIYADFLEELLPHARGEWAIGHERYSRLLREKELLHDDATGQFNLHAYAPRP